MAEASSETRINSKRESQSKDDSALPDQFATVTCGDSFCHQIDNFKQTHLCRGDDDLKEEEKQKELNESSWTTNMDTDKVEVLDELEQKGERQSIWDQLELSEANLNKLDGLSSTRLQRHSSESEIESLTSTAFETWLKENYVKHEGKKPRVRWADIESRLQGQYGSDKTAHPQHWTTMWSSHNNYTS